MSASNATPTPEAPPTDTVRFAVTNCLHVGIVGDPAVAPGEFLVLTLRDPNSGQASRVGFPLAEANGILQVIGMKLVQLQQQAAPRVIRPPRNMLLIPSGRGQ